MDETPRRRWTDQGLAPYLLAAFYVFGAFALTGFVVMRLEVSGEAAAALAGMVVGLIFGKLDLIFPALYRVVKKDQQESSK